MIIYGIKNCDVMKKAFKWLDQKKISYHFHDYRVDGISDEMVKQWLDIIPYEQLVNFRSTTYKELSDEDRRKIDTRNKAIEVIVANPTIVKRPLLVYGKNKILTGFTESVWNAALH